MPRIKDLEIPIEAVHKGISIYVKESRPIEFVNKPLVEHIPCTSSSEVFPKQELIELSESINSPPSSSGERASTFDTKALPFIAKEISPDITQKLMNNNKTKSPNLERPSSESRKSIDSEEPPNGLQNYIQNNYIKTNHPEVNYLSKKIFNYFFSIIISSTKKNKPIKFQFLKRF